MPRKGRKAAPTIPKQLKRLSEVVTMQASGIRNWLRQVRRSNVWTFSLVAILLVVKAWAGYQSFLHRAELQARAAAKAKAAQVTPVAPPRSPPRIEVSAPQGIRPETIKAIEQAIRR